MKLPRLNSKSARNIKHRDFSLGHVPDKSGKYENSGTVETPVIIKVRHKDDLEIL
jgi:hypothetical protein